MLEPLFIDVRGRTPATWGEEKTIMVNGEKRQKTLTEVREWQWRKTLAERVRKKYEKPLSVSRQTTFTVSIVFFLMEQPLKNQDLDNLAKPVLDTLFKVKNSQLPPALKPFLTGALFDIDDSCVYTLIVEKKPVLTRAEEGADITIAWK